jgi:Protein of unknown function (DUF3568)
MHPASGVPNFHHRRLLRGMLRRMIRPLLALALVLVASGCGAALVPAAISIAQLGTTTFSGGSLETVYPQPYSAVVDAVRKTIADLDLKVEVDRPQRGFLYIEAGDLTDKSIAIRVRQRTAYITGLSIRVGFSGDQPYSTALMSRIAGNMKPQDTDPTIVPRPDEPKTPLQAPPPSK